MFVPINPLRTEKGALAVLVDEYGEDAAMPVEISEADFNNLSNFNVVVDALSVSMAAKLQVGSIFTGSASVNEKGFYLDALSYTDKYREQHLPNQMVIATRWGVGIRVLLRVSDIKTDLSLNFGMVAAAAQLGLVTTRYEIQGIGIGGDGLAIVLKNLPQIGDFDFETYNMLSNEIPKKLGVYIEENKSNLIPQPIAVAITKSVDSILSAKSIYYAMRSIAARRSLNDALAKADVEYDRNVIRKVYLQIAGDIGENDRPSKQAEHQAEGWLEF